MFVPAKDVGDETRESETVEYCVLKSVVVNSGLSRRVVEVRAGAVKVSNGASPSLGVTVTVLVNVEVLLMVVNTSGSEGVLWTGTRVTDEMAVVRGWLGSGEMPLSQLVVPLVTTKGKAPEWVVVSAGATVIVVVTVYPTVVVEMIGERVDELSPTAAASAELIDS